MKMEKMNVLTLIITLVVGVILTGALLGPVISDATKTTETFENEGVFNYGVFGPEDTYTLVYDNTNSDGKITVNGTIVTPLAGVSPTEFKSYSVISADNVILRYGSNTSGYYMQIIGKDSDGNNVLGGGSCSATIADGKISVTYSSSDTTLTKIFDFTEMYGIVPESDQAVLKASASSVYIKGDSELYASGVTTVTTWNNVIHFEGNYTDGITISSPNLPSATFSNVTWNITPVSGYIDLYELTSIEFDITYEDTTVHAVYSYFAVPSEITAELSNHLTPGQISLMGAIPVMVIVALLMAAVGAITLRRAD